MIKISIIGAGSTAFLIRLIRDICSSPKLYNSVISLMDINEERLNLAYALCQKYAQEVKAKLIVEKTTNRKECLQGADFVINVALAAGHEYLQEGWKIAFKYGYRFGGSLHIVHDEAFWINFYQLNLMESILLDILEICPKAWYIGVANPVIAGITYLTRKYPQAKIVGMCHGFSGVFYLIETLGLKKEYIKYEVSGVNHFIWLTKFLYKNTNAYLILDKHLKKYSEKFCKIIDLGACIGLKSCDLYKKFGVFPIGDTCNPGGGSWPYWYHTDKNVERKWKENPYKWYKDYFKGQKKTIQQIKKIYKDKTTKITTIYPPIISKISNKEQEPMIPFIESIVCNIPQEIIVNIPNTGYFVKDVPSDFAVEIPTTVDGKGIHPKKAIDLPNSVRQYMIRDRVVPVEMELAAYKEKSIDLLHCLVMMDPWTKSEKQAQNLIKEIFDLPFHKEMRKYYRKPTKNQSDF